MAIAPGTLARSGRANHPQLALEWILTQPERDREAPKRVGLGQARETALETADGILRQAGSIRQLTLAELALRPKLHQANLDRDTRPRDWW